MTHSPLILTTRLDWAMVRWLGEMLTNCMAANYARNKGRMVRLAEFSRDCVIDLRAATGIEYDGRQQGTLQVFRKQKELDGVAKDIEVLKRDGVPFELLNRAGFIAAEPGLASSEANLVGGLRLPKDETGNCFKFTNALAELATEAGVNFKYKHDIQRLVLRGDRIDHVQTDQGAIAADAFLVALAAIRPRWSGRSGSGFLSIRSRATPSPFRSSMRPVLPNRR